jgi:hypothetical protein
MAKIKLSIINITNCFKTKIKIDFGGGLKSDADLKLLLKVVLTKSQWSDFRKWIVEYG